MTDVGCSGLTLYGLRLLAYFLIFAVLALSRSDFSPEILASITSPSVPIIATPQPFQRPVVWLFLDLETLASKVAP